MSYLKKMKPEEKSKIWLVVEWKSSPNSTHNGYSLVSGDDLADNLQLEDFHTGKLVNVRVNGAIRQACIVIVSADKPFLEMEIKHLEEAAHQIGLNKRPSSQQKDNVKRRKTSASQVNNEAEQSDQDFDESASDWSPSAEEESEVEKLPPKTRGKNKKGAAHNSSNQKKKNGTKDKKRESIAKTKGKLPEQNGKPVITSVARLLNRQSEPITFQGASTPPDMRQYQPVVDRIATPQPSMIYNQPRQRHSFIQPPPEYYKVPPMTFDQQTQTNLSNSDPNTMILIDNQKVMNDDITYILKVIEEIGQKMDSMQMAIEQLQYERQNGLPSNRNDPVHEEYNNILPHDQPGPSVLRDSNITNMNNSRENLNTSERDPYTFTSSPPTQSQPQPHALPPNNVHNKHFVHHNMKEPTIINMDGTDMVPIGSGKTLVSRHIYNQIQWSSYTNATRKLLMAVFPRRTLATHSLTGKSSPAFYDKPAKMQLDPKKVTDIIMTVSLMSNTPENLVRNVITTKCADENKMYRVRMEKKKNRKNNVNENDENQSP